MTRLAASVLAAASLTTTLHADDWPHWRGPSTTGIATSSTALPSTWSATVNVAWQVEFTADVVVVF